MPALSINVPFPVFQDRDGQPLDNGYVYIGTANLDPQTNPINVYWDAALTQLAGQPIRTQGGYPVNSGTPARLYVNSDYSIKVINRDGSVVYSAPAATERYNDVVIDGLTIDAENVTYLQGYTGSVQTDAKQKLSETISVFDFMTSAEINAVQNNDYSVVTDVTASIQTAIDSFPNQGTPNWQPFVLVFPPGYYKVISKITITNQQRGEIIGYGAKIIGDFNDVLFQYGAAGTGMIWHSMRGFTFEQANTGANAKAFDMRDVYSCSIVDCFFYGGLTTGYMQGNNNIFEQCSWRGKPLGTTKLMVCGEGSNNQNNTFLNCAFEQVNGFGLCLQSDTAYVGQTYVLSSYFEFCDPVAIYIKNNQSAVIDGCYFNLSLNTGGIRMDGGIGPRYENSPVIVRNCNVLGFTLPPSFVLETSSTAPNLLFDNNQVISGSTDPVNFYGNAPNSVNAAGSRRNPFVANAEYFKITAPNTYPDGWTLGGTLGATTQISQFALYGAGGGIAIPGGTYIYQQINVPANALIKITVVAKISGPSAIAAIQLWSVGLGGQYTAASTTNALGTTLTVYLNSSTRSSATAFLLLLRNTGASNTADFCDIFIEDLTN